MEVEREYGKYGEIAGDTGVGMADGHRIMMQSSSDVPAQSRPIAEGSSCTQGKRNEDNGS